MYGTPYIFHFVHPLVKTAEIMVQRVNFERNLKNIRPPTVLSPLLSCPAQLMEMELAILCPYNLADYFIQFRSLNVGN